MTYKIAIVGTRDAVAGFALLGVDVVPVETAAEAAVELLRIKRETENPYAIAFVTEDLAAGISDDDQKKLAKGALPAIIPLPSHQSATEGASGYGMERLKRIVERAVGSDILQ